MRAGIVSTRAILPPSRVRPKMVRKVLLEVGPDKFDHLDKPLSRVERVHERRLGVLKFLTQRSDPVEPGLIWGELQRHQSPGKG